MRVFERKTKAVWAAKLALLASLLVVSGGSSALSQAAGQGAAAAVPALAAPYKTVTFSNPAPAGATAPFFNHGYLIQFRHHPAAGDSDIWLYNSSGQLAHELTVWPEDAWTLWLTSVDVSAGGRLAFAGQAVRNDGSRYLFIATSDLNGENPQYFSTGNFLAPQIAAADDGSVWSVGAESPPPDGSPRRWSNYDALRHYSASSVLLESFLPRWGKSVAYVETVNPGAKHTILAAYDSSGNRVETYAGPEWGPTMSYSPANMARGQTYLRVGASEVVLLDQLNRQLYKFTKGGPLERWSIVVPTLQEQRLTGAGIASNGNIYASLVAAETYTNASDQSYEGKTIGLYTLIFAENGSSAEWTAVPNATAAATQIRVGSVRRMLGCEGPDLVYLRFERHGLPRTARVSHR